MTKLRRTDDSFVENQPQCIGPMHKPGGGHLYMKPEGAPDLYSAGGFRGNGGVSDGYGYHRSDVLHWQVGRDRFVGNPLASGVTDDSMGRGSAMTREDPGGY